MGSAFLAVDEGFRGNGRRVVVKVPHARLLNEEFRRRFEREIDDLASLEHPRVIPVYDAGEHEGLPFLVVRHVGGGDLRQRMRPGEHLTPEQVMEWLPAVAEGLDFVHRRGRLHRDVKPGNVLFDVEGNAYLSDFGIATVMTSLESDAADRTQLTSTGGWAGSPAYAPPEAVVRDLRPQYDQYSLGMVVYEALSASLPFAPTDASQLMSAKLYDEPASLTERVPKLGGGVGAAVMRALSRRPGDRFASCGEFVRAFEQGMSAEAEPAVPVPASEAPTRLPGTETQQLHAPIAPPARRRGGRAAVVLLLLALGVAGVWGLGPGSGALQELLPTPAAVAPRAAVPTSPPARGRAPAPDRSPAPAEAPGGAADPDPEPAAAAAPAPEPARPPDPDPTVEPRDEIAYAQRNANVRSAPTVRATRVARLERGVEVEVTGEVVGAEWLRIATDEGAAFVFAPLLAAQPPPPPEPPSAAPDPPARSAVPADMVRIPAGSFFYGCNEQVDRECDDDEKPGRHIELPAFSIDRNEVSVAAYRRCVEGGGCSADGTTMPFYQGEEKPAFAWACNWAKTGRESHPMNCVDWEQARSYCAWAGKRLPGEEEWEKAARGTDGRKFPWGNVGFEPGQRVANIADETAKKKQPGWSIAVGYDDGYYATSPVGRFPAGASPAGALDMAGNVWEWTESRYSSGSEARVVRGGSWSNEPRFARASARYVYVPSYRLGDLGFRCAQ